MIPVVEPENTTSALYMLPAYIRTTSMVACIIVMILGIVGNLMVSSRLLHGHSRHRWRLGIFSKRERERK